MVRPPPTRRGRVTLGLGGVACRRAQPDRSDPVPQPSSCYSRGGDHQSVSCRGGWVAGDRWSLHGDSARRRIGMSVSVAIHPRSDVANVESRCIAGSPNSMMIPTLSSTPGYGARSRLARNTPGCATVRRCGPSTSPFFAGRPLSTGAELIPQRGKDVGQQKIIHQGPSDGADVAQCFRPRGVAGLTASSRGRDAFAPVPTSTTHQGISPVRKRETR